MHKIEEASPSVSIRWASHALVTILYDKLFCIGEGGMPISFNAMAQASPISSKCQGSRLCIPISLLIYYTYTFYAEAEVAPPFSFKEEAYTRSGITVQD